MKSKKLTFTQYFLKVVISGTLTGIFAPAHGQWTKHFIDNNLGGAMGLCIADIIHDDTLDVVTTGRNANNVVWYEAPLWTKYV